MEGERIGAEGGDRDIKKPIDIRTEQGFKEAMAEYILLGSDYETRDINQARVFLHARSPVGEDSMVCAMLDYHETRPELRRFQIPYGFSIKGWVWKDWRGKDVIFPYFSFEELAELFPRYEAHKYAAVMGSMDGFRDTGEWECPHVDSELACGATRRTVNAPGDFTPVYVCKDCGEVRLDE